MDRVAEAYKILAEPETDDDIVVCPGDEPLHGSDTISAVIDPFENDPQIHGTMLAVPIMDEATLSEPDIVKIVHDLRGNVLYTSRQPIPIAMNFRRISARCVGGIFGFRWHMLKWFTELPESPLERVEHATATGFATMAAFQRIAPISARAYYSVDSPEDVALVEAAIADDPLWGNIDRIGAITRHELRHQGRGFAFIDCRCHFCRGMEYELALPTYDPAGHVVWHTIQRQEQFWANREQPRRQIKNSGDYNVSIRFNRHGFSRPTGCISWKGE